MGEDGAALMRGTVPTPTAMKDNEQDRRGASYPADPSVAARLAAFFAEENRLLEEVQAHVAERTEAFWGVIFPLLYSISDSNRAFHLLAPHTLVQLGRPVSGFWV
jgi:hypothetical protein